MSHPIHLLDLISREKLDGVLRVFTGVTGVAAIIAHTDGSPVSKPHNFTQFCHAYCRSTPEGRKRCHESDRHGGHESVRARRPHIFNCLNAGLIDSAAPVIVEGYHLATILCGQVLEEPLDEETAIQRARAIGVGDFEGYLRELEKIPIMSRERLLAIVNLMAVITQTISELALQKYLAHKRSRQYLNRLINSVSDCILSTNADNTISMINEAGARMFGYDMEELIGQPILKLFSDELSRESYSDQVRRKPNMRWRAELSAGAADGSIFPVHVSLSGINAQEEANGGYVGVIRDISEEKKIQRMKEDLIGMVTHDMRNPVLSVQKAIQLLVSGSLGGLNRRQREIMNMALATSYEIYGMANDLLDIYLHENGKFLLHRSVLEIRRIVEESIGRLELFAREKRISIVFESSRERLLVAGDLNRLMRTYVNLLDNAIKYSPEGSVIAVACTLLDGSDDQTLRALVPEEAISSLESGRHYVLTSISDQGIGIPVECQNLIFDKFFPINNRKRTERKGVGLGLAFCKQVIEAHGGRIWLQSPIEKDGTGRDCGCRFSFVLPAHEETVQQ